MPTQPNSNFVSREDSVLACSNISLRRGLLALSPVLVFILLYLAVSIIIGDFYKMPLAVALVVSSIWAVCIDRGRSLSQRIDLFSREAAQTNVLYMVWIFILAGSFAYLAQNLGCVEATVNLTLSVFPSRYIIPALFAAACFISMAIGTSVGTVVALTPLAVKMAEMAGNEVPFYVAVVLGGAFFGDNLSFISDTTIAATRTQAVSMSAKFRANFAIVCPAALITILCYILTPHATPALPEAIQTNFWLVIPYISIIVLAIAGVNVTLVLIIGILLALLFGLIFGSSLLDMTQAMGAGIDSMGNLIIVTLLAAGMLGMVKAQGGILWLLQHISARVKGQRGAKFAIAFLVSVVNLCTANNTVAIITVGSMSRDIASRFNIPPQRTASLLDTCSCIVQCLIPYGAQALLATSMAGISPVAPFPYLYYPWILTAVVLIAILFSHNNLKHNIQ